MNPKRERFAPNGFLALEPKAFGGLFLSPIREEEEPTLTEDGVAIVDICGPIESKRGYFFDSYEAIVSRIGGALDQGARAIVMRFDSPGGVVTGMIDASHKIRNMCKARGVPLLAHVHAQATSAAYALACSAEYIGISQTAAVGSIGVIDVLFDHVRRNEMEGLNVQVIASGARKDDTNPDSPITDNAIAESQRRVDQLAGAFFQLVVDHGWASSAEDVAAMQASVLHGDVAVAAGLATEVISFDDLISNVNRLRTEAKANTGANQMNPMEEARKALRGLAEGDDEEMAKKAKAALAALAEGDEEEPEAEGDEEEKAEGDEEEKDEGAKAEGDEEEKEEDAKAAYAMAAKAMAEVHRMKAERKQDKTRAERAELIASRPDFSDEMIAVLQKAPLATVRELCSTLPKGERKRRAVASVTAIGTRGASEGNGEASRLSPEDKARLDAAMGLVNTKSAVAHVGNRTSFGVRKPITNEGK